MEKVIVGIHVRLDTDGIHNHIASFDLKKETLKLVMPVVSNKSFHDKRTIRNLQNIRKEDLNHVMVEEYGSSIVEYHCTLFTNSEQEVQDKVKEINSKVYEEILNRKSMLHKWESDFNGLSK